MSISKPKPPASASEAATSRLASLERARGRIPDLEAGGGTLANPEQCLPVYYLDSALGAKDGVSLAAATLVGWQYLIGKGHDAKSVEVVNNVAVAVDRGQVALDIKLALDIAQDNVSDWDYEARMLTFGRVANPVLWLHPENGSVERFFSLGLRPHEVTPERVLADVRASASVREKSWSTSRDRSDDESGG